MFMLGKIIFSQVIKEYKDQVIWSLYSYFICPGIKIQDMKICVYFF